MDALRGFITSGVEAASCLLLQDHFAWRQDSIGFCIGMTFCLVVPGYMLHKQYQARYSDIAWIRIYTGIAMLATALLGRSSKRSCKSKSLDSKIAFRVALHRHCAEAAGHPRGG